MNQGPPRDMAASVRQRLLNRAHESGRPFNEVLQYYAMERFLYRLSVSPHGSRFVLKGALMFNVWQAAASRPTRDIDLLGRMSNTIEDVVAAFREVCQQSVEPDGLAFDPSSVGGQRIVEDADYEGVRVTLRGALGTARVSIQVDIGFSDVVVPEATEIEYPTLLDFPPPRLRGYSRESVIAEKFEAMTSLGRLNSRMKDFYDLWFLSKWFDFDGRILADAVAKTFANRGTTVEAKPIALTVTFCEDPIRQTQWTAFVRKGLLQDVPGQLVEVISAIDTFLGPMADAVANGRPFEGRWHSSPSSCSWA